MASKKHSEGGLSRRDFIKTTTAATAAASVGIVPTASMGSNLPESATAPQQPPWSITGKEIQTFWTDIWPKIVALAWWSDAQQNPLQNPSYRCVFERDGDFRVAEAKRIAEKIGVYYDSDIPICVTAPSNLNMLIEGFMQFNLPDPFSKEERDPDRAEDPTFTGWSCPQTLYGDTFFVINEHGFVMPWPNMDPQNPLTANQIYIGYLEGGGILPRINPMWDALTTPPNAGLPLPPVAGPQLPEREYRFFEEITAWTDPGGINCATPPPLCPKLTGLSGS